MSKVYLETNNRILLHEEISSGMFARGMYARKIFEIADNCQEDILQRDQWQGDQ